MFLQNVLFMVIHIHIYCLVEEFQYLSELVCRIIPISTSLSEAWMNLNVFLNVVLVNTLRYIGVSCE